MHKTSGLPRLTAVYLIGVLLLSSIDVIYEWFSPLVNEAGQSTGWYEMVGLRAGFVLVANHEGRPADGFVTGVHLPQFSPRCPFFPALAPRAASWLSRCGSSASWRGAFIC